MVNNKFTWVPFFKEAHEKIHNNYNAKQLANIANKIFGHIKDIENDGKEMSIQEMTPINFIGYFNRRLKLNNKIQYCQKLKEIMKLTSETPIDFEGIPEFNNQNCLCMKFKKDRADYIVKEQWKISKEILDDNINPELFDKILSPAHPYIGLSYLSRFCFIVKPDKYYPFDKQMVKNLNVLKPNSYSDYINYCNLLKEFYKDKTPYELSEEAFKQNKNFDNNDNELINESLVNVPKGVDNMNQPLNQILYGPPGTGKTYNTVLKAMSIIDNTEYKNVSDEQYSALKTRFDELKQAGQIEFVTFHQSYSYEEFVEGIKPYIPEWGITDNTEVKYIGENGIFKRICKKAENPIIENSNNNLELNESPKIWKVSLMKTGENDIRKDCMENNRIRIGFDKYGETINDETVFDDGGSRVLTAFIDKMEIGDIVLSCYSEKTIDAIGVIISEYKWNDEFSQYKRYRDVKWLAKGLNHNILEINNGTKFTLGTVYQLNNMLLKDVLDIIDEQKQVTSYKNNDKPYILIIDEINRGDVSKIFGELITLIEEDKRIGNKYQMKITLPYSKELFGIPKNLYIIGTMNTADRSIALLDTALRRRFDFEEIMPRPELLSGKVIEGINLQTLLTRINERITNKYDRDHQIGHSYLMGVNTKEQLERTYKNRILPLLNEYFYNESKTVAEILNCSEDELKTSDFISILGKAQGA